MKINGQDIAISIFAFLLGFLLALIIAANYKGVNVDLLVALVAGILTIVGWLYSSHAQSKQEVANKKREKVVEHLITSYQNLSNSVHRGNINSDLELTKAFENAFTNIQLMGSEKQIALARKASEDFANKGSVDLSPLLTSLREQLREELDLPALADAPFFYQRLRKSE